MIETVKKILRVDEGFREKPYFDHLGYPTIGYGFRIPNTKQHDPLPPITMTREAAEEMLDKKVKEVSKILSSNDFKEIWPAINDIRKAVLTSMAFQLGVYGLLKFRQMRVGLSSLDYKKASDEIIDSAAWRDPKTRDRFTRNSQMMLTGKLSEHYK